MKRLAAASLVLVSCAAPTLVAHRGAPASVGQEETLVAYRADAAEGADAVEGDVHVTRDGALVLLHDDTVDRTTSDHGCIGEKTAEEARSLGLATVDELLDGTPLPVELELKVPAPPCPPIDAALVVRALVDVLRAHSAVSRARITSFDPGVLDEIATVEPRVRRALLVRDRLDFGAIAAHRIDAVEVDEKLLDAPAVRALRDRGVEVGAWTVDDPDRAAELARMGVVRIVTDRPRALASRFSGHRDVR